MFRIGLTFDPIVKFVSQWLADMSFDLAKLFHATVVRHQNIFVLKGVAVGFGDIAHAGRPYMCDHAIGFNFGREVAQVTVVPSGVYRYKCDGLVIYLWHIPAYAKAIAIEGFFNFAGVAALIDQ